MGNALQAGIGQNPAREAAMRAGIPDVVPSMTVNKVCGSGLKAVMLAAQAVRAVTRKCSIARGHGKHDECSLHLAGGSGGLSNGRSQGRRQHDPRRAVVRVV